MTHCKPCLLVPLLALFVALPLLGGCVSLTPYAELKASLPAEQFVDVDGTSVHVVQRGSGPPIVLLHGFGASAWSWRQVTPLLAEGTPGFRTIAVDLHGFGATERPAGVEPYTREGQIALVLGVMDEMGLERVHLVGHSYGGALAQTMAVRHPERLLSLTLVDAARPDYPRDRRSRMAAVRPLDAAFLRTFGLRRGSVRSALEHSVADDSLVTDELVAGYRDRLAVEGAGRAYYGLTRPTPASSGQRDGKDATVDISRIAVPTLVVWGAEDALISVDDARQRAEEIEGSRFVVLDEVGHLPMEEAPARLAEEIRQFLATSSAAPE